MNIFWTVQETLEAGSLSTAACPASQSSMSLTWALSNITMGFGIIWYICPQHRGDPASSALSA